MAIILYLQNRKYQLLGKIGMVEDMEVMALTKAAIKYELHCLRGIDFVGDTILNQGQLKILKKELYFLMKQPEAATLNMAPFDEATNETMKYPDLYLMVNGE